MWHLDGTKARLESPQLSCELNLASPADGATQLKVDLESTRPFSWSEAKLMQLILPSDEPRLEDAYVRGNDLVATYDESTDHACRTQVYWRFECDDEHVGIQLIISAQTSRLDAVPGMVVASQVSSPASQIDDGAMVASLPDGDVSYAELTDRSNIESTTFRDSQITYQLFPGSLEKGVIRRARILCCFLPNSSAERTARMLRDSFARSAPPLTT
ncbi:MAG: hypothetical protein H8E66_03330 [Planctomycetes bacterium]|nr:hypothetical protein [Planctomycetota bacterium]